MAAENMNGLMTILLIGETTKNQDHHMKALMEKKQTLVFAKRRII